MKIETKIKQTQKFLQAYMKSALELGEIFKKITEEKFGREFEVQLGWYETGVDCIRINMVIKKEMDWREERKLNTKLFRFETKLAEEYSFGDFYIKFGTGRPKEWV